MADTHDPESPAMTMPDAPVPCTPLMGREYHGRDAAMLHFVERPFIGKLTLRGNVDNGAFSRKVRDVLGAALPTMPLHFAESGEKQIFWVSPDEWMIWTTPGTEANLASDLEAALANLHRAVINISDYYTIIRLSGTKARALLAKGCALDLHPRAFGPGRCAGTGFQHASIFLAQLDDAPTYDIMIRWSVAAYLWDYLADGAREWADSSGQNRQE